MLTTICFSPLGLLSQIGYNLISSILRALADTKRRLLLFCSDLTLFEYSLCKKFGLGVPGALGLPFCHIYFCTLCFMYVQPAIPTTTGKTDFKHKLDFYMEHLAWIAMALPFASRLPVSSYSFAALIVPYYIIQDLPFAKYTTRHADLFVGCHSNIRGQNYGPAILVCVAGVLLTPYMISLFAPQ